MTNSSSFYIFLLAYMLLNIGLDIYVFQGLKTAFKQHKKQLFVWWFSARATLHLLVILSVFVSGLGSAVRAISFFVSIIGTFTLIIYSLFLLVDDIKRLFVWQMKSKSKKIPLPENTEKVSESSGKISRSTFLSRLGFVSSAVPILIFTNGISNGAVDFVIRKQKLSFPHFPKSFNGLKIAQISDIHCGSILNERMFFHFVDMVMKQKPDIILFTGDIVNEVSVEAKEFISRLSKLKAPLGIYSILGNHDYGDYAKNLTKVQRKENFKEMLEIHKTLNWDLMMNENRILKEGSDTLALLGSENWGNQQRFSKRGSIKKTIVGAENADFRLLMTHDPSHWRHEVLDYPSIELTLSGHTHGMQFGVYTEHFKWSPSKYMYKEWGGLYQEGQQQIYVNVGLGCIGYPGRIGMPPEITIFELENGTA